MKGKSRPIFSPAEAQERLRKKGITNIHSKEEGGANLLMQCIGKGGDDKLVQLYLDAGVDVNAVDDSCNTALLIATLLGRTEITELLLARGANPDIPDIYSRTASWVAQSRGNVRILRAIALSKGELVEDEKEKEEEVAVVKKSPEERLQELMLSLQKFANDGAKVGASERREYDEMLQLIRPFNVNTATLEGWSVLHFAAKFGAGGEVKSLVDLGAEVNAMAGAEQVSTLRCAVLANNRESIRTILECGNLQFPTILDGLEAAIKSGNKNQMAAMILESPKMISEFSNYEGKKNVLLDRWSSLANGIGNAEIKSKVKKMIADSEVAKLVKKSPSSKKHSGLVKASASFEEVTSSEIGEVTEDKFLVGKIEADSEISSALQSFEGFDSPPPVPFASPLDPEYDPASNASFTDRVVGPRIKPPEEEIIKIALRNLSEQFPKEEVRKSALDVVELDPSVSGLNPNAAEFKMPAPPATSSVQISSGAAQLKSSVSQQNAPGDFGKC